jgi:hypothetical protein
VEKRKDFEQNGDGKLGFGVEGLELGSNLRERFGEGEGGKSSIKTF